MATTSKPNTKAPTTTKATKATSKPSTPTKPVGPFVPAEWVRSGGRGQGFVRYQRLGAGNRHAVSGYNTAQASRPDEQALLADIAKGLGMPVDGLGAYVVVDWSTGAIATGCGSWADALVVVRSFGGHTSLAGSVGTSASKPMQQAVAANGVEVRPIVRVDADAEVLADA